jgi:hypothetical protein
MELTILAKAPEGREIIDHVFRTGIDIGMRRGVNSGLRRLEVKLESCIIVRVRRWCWETQRADMWLEFNMSWRAIKCLSWIR